MLDTLSAEASATERKGPFLIPQRLAVPFSAFLVLVVVGSPASAQVDPWEFEVYPYGTARRGVIEWETNNAVILKGHQQGGTGTATGTFPSQSMWYNQYQVTYGVTDRIEAAVYLLMARPGGQGYGYAGAKFRLRGRLFDAGVLPVDLGWYAELGWHKTPQLGDADVELELRPILEKDVGRFSLVAEPKFEKVLKGVDADEGFEFGYAAGLHYRWMDPLSFGVELYGGMGLIGDAEPLAEQQHYLVPVLWGELPFGIEYSVGPGFGLTRGSDRVFIKLNLGLEHHVGAIFGPSSPSGWLF